MARKGKVGSQGAARAQVAPAWLAWGLPLAIFVLTLLPFTPALSYGFVQYDDDRNFDAQFNPFFNAAAHDLSAERLEWMFKASHLGHYQPLTWLSLSLDAAVAGRFDPRDFHRTNLLLHGLVAVLVFRLALRVLRLAWGAGRPAGDDAGLDLRLRLAAAATALLYGVHPLRVESVAWVTERRDVLSGVFLLGAVLAYLRYAQGESRRGAWMALSLSCFVLSLLSKAWGITLPVVLLVLDVYPLRRRSGEPPVGWGRLIAEKLGYLPLALLFAWLAARAQGETLARVSLAEHGVLQRIAQACYGLVFYPLKTLWPASLSPLYLLESDGLDPARAVYVTSMIAAIAITSALLVARRRFPAGLAAWAAYAILVSPVLGLLQSGSQKVADRYTYLAGIPLALLAGGLVLGLLGPRGEGVPRARERGVVAGTGLVVALLAVLSWRQTRVWRDSESVYRRVVEVEPGNYFGRHCLSVVLHNQGRLAEALEHARASVEAHPRKGNEPARYNLGQLLRKTGKPEEALEAFRGALEVAPDHMDSLRELVTERLMAMDTAGAVALVEQALARAPLFLDGYAELARLQTTIGRRDLALEAWQRALRVDRGWPPALHALGIAALEQGRPAEAQTLLVRALAGEERAIDVETLIDLGRAYQAQGRTPEALSCFNQALALQPQNARARALLQALSDGRP